MEYVTATDNFSSILLKRQWKPFHRLKSNVAIAMQSATSTPTSALAVLSALVATPSHSRLTLSIANYVADALNWSSLKTKTSHYNPSPFFFLSCHHPLASFLLRRKKAALSRRRGTFYSTRTKKGRVVHPHKWWQKKDIIIFPCSIALHCHGCQRWIIHTKCIIFLFLTNNHYDTKCLIVKIISNTF